MTFTAEQALAAVGRKPPQCSTCAAAQAIGVVETAKLIDAIPVVGYRGVARAFGLMGHKVSATSIKTHLENGHSPHER